MGHELKSVKIKRENWQLGEIEHTILLECLGLLFRPKIKFGGVSYWLVMVVDGIMLVRGQNGVAKSAENFAK